MHPAALEASIRAGAEALPELAEPTAAGATTEAAAAVGRPMSGMMRRAVARCLATDPAARPAAAELAATATAALASAVGPGWAAIATRQLPTAGWVATAYSCNHPY